MVQRMVTAMGVSGRQRGSAWPLRDGARSGPATAHPRRGVGEKEMHTREENTAGGRGQSRIRKEDLAWGHWVRSLGQRAYEPAKSSAVPKRLPLEKHPPVLHTKTAGTGSLDKLH